MQVVVLSARTGWQTDELCRALSERGHVGVVVPYDRLLARCGDPGRAALISRDVPVLQADAVLARIIPNGSLEQVIYRVDALHWIAHRGIAVVNTPRTIERCVDKFLTTTLLQDAGLPVPDTIVCEHADDAVDAIREFGDAVVKPIFGSMGHGMVRVSDPEVGFRICRSLEQINSVFYVQRTIAHDGRDVRAFVVGGRVLGAIERRAPAGDWRTNVSRGGTARAIALPAAWDALAVQAAAIVGADYAGVDLLPAADGRVYVLEVNAIPGWQGLQEATGLDVAGAIVDHVVTRVRGSATVTGAGT